MSDEIEPDDELEIPELPDNWRPIPDSLILDGTISDRAVRVYCVLFTFGTSDGRRIFPKRETLAERLDVSVPTIARGLAELRKRGWITVRSRGRGRSNVYRLERVDPRTREIRSDTRDGSDLTRGGGSDLTRVTRVSEREPENETCATATSVVEQTRATLDLVESFDAWWQRYPRKVAKPAARKSFGKAIKSGATVDELHAGLTKWLPYWAAKGETEFIPHPATWLNQERWNDDVVVPENRNRQASLDVLDSLGGGRS